MSFTVDKTKTGKPCILFNGTKYRQQRILKNVEVSWRCQGKSCGASIKTDAGMTQVITSNQKHSGVHPVTMRTLLSPLLKSQTVTAASPAMPAVPCTPPALNSCEIPVCSTPAMELSLSDDLPDPLAEISRLRKEIERLESEYQKVGHSFARVHGPNISSEHIPRRPDRPRFRDSGLRCPVRAVSHFTRGSFAYCGGLCCAGTSRHSQTDRAPTVDSAVQSESSSQPSCQLTDSALQCELLGPTVEVEVLEAEEQCLKLQSITCEDESMSEQPWTWVVHKKSAKEKNYIKVQNTHSATKYKHNKPKRKRRKNKNMRNQITQAPKTVVQFKTVGISGDSHACHLVGLVGKLVAPATAVSGICKPGAKLLNILRPSPTHNSHCEVLIAGSNDLADGEQKNIYLHLERQIAARPTNSEMVIVTLPHRHDLEPDNPTHLETALVNAFIQELAVRHGTRVVDFNRISRQCFTAHGQHLNMSGKRKLAELVVESLAAECT
ncbi:hypothetical protein J6590_094447, partial [Homalodisca vitripennis]